MNLVLQGWDHHDDLHSSQEGGLRSLSKELDDGMAHLIDTLKTKPAVGQASGSMFDQTLIVAMGEFGRTPGGLSSSGGRDHYQYVFAGSICWWWN